MANSRAGTSAGLRDLQIERFRFAIAERKRRCAVFDTLEELGIARLSLIDRVQRDGVVVARRQVRDLEAAVLIWLPGFDVARLRIAPALAIAREDDDRVVLHQGAAAIPHRSKKLTLLVRHFDLESRDLVASAHLYSCIG